MAPEPGSLADQDIAYLLRQQGALSAYRICQRGAENIKSLGPVEAKLYRRLLDMDYQDGLKTG